MTIKMTRFPDAVFHRKDMYDFGMTIFSRKDLKVLMLVDGKKTADEIADTFFTDAYSLMPQFEKLVKLGLIRMEDGSNSAGAAGGVFSEKLEVSPGFSATTPA